MERSKSVSIWLILSGAMALWLSLPWILRWTSAVPPLRVHVAVFVATSVPMIAAGAALRKLRPSGPIRWGASLASAVCGVNLLWGVLAGTIPCAGPG